MKLLNFLRDKTILITGGTGSVGKRLVEVLLAKSPAKKIIIFSRDEFKQFQIKQQLPDSQGRLRFFIGDIRDPDRLRWAFDGVDYIIHTAALKHVPILEYNPFEAVMTNIIGTQNIITAALNQGVKKVLLISTDKANNPVNLYGATKLCAERLVTCSNAYSGKKGTKLSVVRYGNVVGSRGSLVKIIEGSDAKRKLSLTHKDMTRFWITIDQSVDLILNVLKRMFGGEIFVPKIPSMKVMDFMKGLAPGREIEITGIRPGERLHEILINPEEARRAKEFNDYYVILPDYDWWRGHDRYKNGKDLSEDFHFSSDSNKRQLSPEEIKKLISSL